MKIWEIIQTCANGGYIADDAFVNQHGERIVFDGEKLIGVSELKPNDVWEYVDPFSQTA